MTIPQGVLLFSPKFLGSIEAWNWICERSNSRPAVPPELNEAQRSYALNAGYLTNQEASKPRSQ